MHLVWFGPKWILGLTLGVAFLIGLTFYSQQSEAIANFFITFSPIVVGTIFGLSQALTNKSTLRIVGACTAYSAVFNLFVGGIAMQDGKIRQLLDPTHEFLSPEVWFVLMLPFHVISASIVSLLFGLPLRRLLCDHNLSDRLRPIERQNAHDANILNR
jgi:hypothetical protein